MTDIYTAGIWMVKPGREEEFIRLWQRLGERTLDDFPAASGTLLRDRERPHRFVSFGPWESIEQVEHWRSSPAFQDSVRELRDVLDSFEPGTFDVAIRMRASRDRSEGYD
jgi:quinol monooxygenase YgiN